MAISIFIASADYRSHVRRKIRAYHVFIRAGASPKVCCSMVVAAKLVWDSFGSWLRNIRPGIPPSEFVVASALPGNASRFSPRLRKKNGSLAKFIADRQDTGNMRILVPDAPPIDLERRKRMVVRGPKQFCAVRAQCCAISLTVVCRSTTSTPTIRKATIRRLEASTYWGRPRKSGGEIRVNCFRNRRVNGGAAAQVRVFSSATSSGPA